MTTLVLKGAEITLREISGDRHMMMEQGEALIRGLLMGLLEL